jgi:hypothetical protein
MDDGADNGGDTILKNGSREGSRGDHALIIIIIIRTLVGYYE